MHSSIETQIINAEEKLRIAMLESDVNTLDKLLAPELIFTNHLGQVLRKEDDINAHKAGIVKINQLEYSERQIQPNKNIAIVSVKMSLSGSYNNTPANSNFRFTRIWAISPAGNWHVIAAHSSIVS